MDVVDIAIVGSGIASTVTLVEVFGALLNNAPATGKVTITVIEKHHEFWKGIPYGSRSSVNALTITSVHDFINERERPPFFEWLLATKSEWAAWYREQGGITAARWLENNLPLIDKNEWETIYVPRFLFGNYLEQKLARLRKAVEEKNLAEIKLVQAEATDVANAGSNYEITFERTDKTVSKITARKVVIAAGSAPVRKMCDIPGNEALYINDIYNPSVKGNLEILQTELGKNKNDVGSNVLIIGSNASSIELLYLLEGLPDLRKLINKTVIISPSGALPYHISTETLAEHPIPNLEKYKVEGDYNIKPLSEAASKDIRLAMANGANMDYVATVIKNTLELLEPLGEQARKEFFGIHAIKLRDSFRRSGPEYKGVSQLLIDNEEVTIIKGKVVNTCSSENGVQLFYLDVATGKEQTYPLSFKAVINCSGSDNLNESSSRLLYNLTNKGLAIMNLSGKGFEVNEKFEAAPNIYVMGPLLGGNVNKLIHFWQLENASRLTYLAPYLAKELVGG